MKFLVTTEYRKVKNRCTALNNKLKSEFIKSKFNEAGNDLRKTFRVANDLIRNVEQEKMPKNQKVEFINVNEERITEGK